MQTCIHQECSAGSGTQTVPCTRGAAVSPPGALADGSRAGVVSSKNAPASSILRVPSGSHDGGSVPATSQARDMRERAFQLSQPLFKKLVQKLSPPTCTLPHWPERGALSTATNHFPTAEETGMGRGWPVRQGGEPL